MSINKITYLHQFQFDCILVKSTPLQSIFPMWDSKDIQIFLNGLDDRKTYLISMEFVLSWLNNCPDDPFYILSKPILITNKSNSELISKFIYKQIIIACENNSLEDFIIEKYGKNDGPGVVITFAQIELY